jgi:hypothetical protein
MIGITVVGLKAYSYSIPDGGASFREEKWIDA